MPTTPLVDPLTLQGMLDARSNARSVTTLVFDCSFDLVKPEAGRQGYLTAHVPGATYVHLDEDLSSAKNGRNGRHPLPTREVFAARMAGRGVRRGVTVVAYDNAGGMYASRLWWMLRWIGHADVAVLDGGLAAWKAAGLPLEAGAATGQAGVGPTDMQPSRTSAVDRQTLLDNLGRTDPSARYLIVDARSPDRFRGENETLDPVGGRIPGAVNRFFKDNLTPEGRFKEAVHLREEWLALIRNREPSSLVMQCGSGVTACHNLLSLEVAGLSGAALYPGSWSEWCAWPDAPVATGPA